MNKPKQAPAEPHICATCAWVDFWKSTKKPRVVACHFRKFPNDGEVADAPRWCKLWAKTRDE